MSLLAFKKPSTNLSLQALNPDTKSLNRDQITKKIQVDQLFVYEMKRLQSNA